MMMMRWKLSQHQGDPQVSQAIESLASLACILNPISSNASLKYFLIVPNIP